MKERHSIRAGNRGWRAERQRHASSYPGRRGKHLPSDRRSPSSGASGLASPALRSPPAASPAGAAQTGAASAPHTPPVPGSASASAAACARGGRGGRAKMAPGRSSAGGSGAELPARTWGCPKAARLLGGGGVHRGVYHWSPFFFFFF